MEPLELACRGYRCTAQFDIIILNYYAPMYPILAVPL